MNDLELSTGGFKVIIIIFLNCKALIFLVLCGTFVRNEKLLNQIQRIVHSVA